MPFFSPSWFSRGRTLHTQIILYIICDCILILSALTTRADVVNISEIMVSVAMMVKAAHAFIRIY